MFWVSDLCKNSPRSEITSGAEAEPLLSHLAPGHISQMKWFDLLTSPFLCHPPSSHHFLFLETTFGGKRKIEWLIEGERRNPVGTVGRSDQGRVRLVSASAGCPLDTSPPSNFFCCARFSEPGVVCWFSKSPQIAFSSTFSVSPGIHLNRLQTQFWQGVP